MVFFNYALRKLNAKIVYYGPGLCGKTTNLQWIHDHFEGGQRGKMISLATEGDRTIFFDLLPIDIGSIRGMDVTLQLYTVPGQVHYNSTRQLVLRGADGVVFVADSQRTMKSSNAESFENLQENLMLQGIDLKSFPHILQFNKRDLRDLSSTEDLNENLNVFSVPIFEAIATEGIGVQESLEGIVKLVMRNLREKYEPMASAGGPQAPSPMQVTGPMAFQSPPVEPAVDVPASVEPVGFEVPQTVAPPLDETQAVGPDSGFAAFQSEDGISTAVYKESDEKIAEFEATLGDSAFPVDEDTSPDGQRPDESDQFEGLFTDPRDEDGTGDVGVPMQVAPAFTPDEPVDEPEAKEDLSTDPEYVVEDPQPEPPSESLDDLFETEVPDVKDFVNEMVQSVEEVDESFAEAGEEFVDQVVESVEEVDESVAEEGEEFVDQVVESVEDVNESPTETGGEFVDEVDVSTEEVGESIVENDEDLQPTVLDPSMMVVLPPQNDRFEDRIEAPGPFAPASAKKTEIEADFVGTESEHEHQEINDEIRQAFGSSENREALASLSNGVSATTEEAAGIIGAPPEVQPVVLPPEESKHAEPVDFIDEATPTALEPDVADEPEELPVEAPTFEAPEEAVEEVVEPVVEETAVDEPAVENPPEFIPVPPPSPEADDPNAKSQPVFFGTGDPFADEDIAAVVVPEVVPEAAPVVPVSNRIDVHADDNQLHLQLKGSGAIAEMGQVRALDIEVPVPGQWVGNRKVTLQLRLTLTPAEDGDD